MGRAAVLLLLLLGCRAFSDDDGPGPLDLPPPPGAVPVATEAFIVDSSLTGPLFLRLTADLLIVGDVRVAPFLHVYDRHDGAPRLAFGEQGEGPGQFSQVPEILEEEDPDGILWLHDGDRGRFTGYRLTDLARGIAAPARITRYERSGRWLWSARGHGRDVVGVYAPPADWPAVVRMAIGDSMPGAPGQPVPIEDPGIPLLDRSSAYWARLCRNPIDRRMALVYARAGRVDLLDSAGRWQRSAKVPHAYRPWVGTIPGTSQPAFKGGEPGVRQAYTACFATGAALYAVHQGRRNRYRAEPKLEEPHSALHIFGWDGELRRVLLLDHYVGGIAVDGDSVLYMTAGERDGPFEIRRMRLPR